MKLEINGDTVVIDSVQVWPKPEVREEPKAWPQIGDDYYHILSDGTIEGDRFSYDFISKRNRQKCLQSIGNMFPTREHAERHLETQKVLTEFRALGRKFENGMATERNYGIRFDTNVGTISIDNWGKYPCCFASTYFDTRKQLEVAIDKVGEERILRAMRYLELGEI